MQVRLRDYEEDLLSFEHNIFNMGLHYPGRYAGFDAFSVDTGALVGKLTHVNTGIRYKNQAMDEQGPCGIAMTPQGIIIRETAPILGLGVDTNAGNPNTRWDLIVINHTYQNIAGGTAATYEVIKGSMSAPTKPQPSDPLLQTIMGYLEIPPNASSIDNMRWRKAKCPDSGDEEDARLLDVNIFKALQGLAKSESPTGITDSLVTGGHTASLWSLSNDGNQFELSTPNPTTNNVDGLLIRDVPLQDGIRIHLIITEKHIIRESRHFEGNLGLYAKGYRGFTIPTGLGNLALNGGGGGSLLAIQPSVGETWEIEAVFRLDRWWVVGINGASSKTQFIRGMTMVWQGDIVANTDATGKGINLLSGWALVNGNNGTTDPRGKQLAVATDQPSAGRPILTEEAVIGAGGDPFDYIFGVNNEMTMGKTEHEILQSNLPPYYLTVLDPGHMHYTHANVDAASGNVNSTNVANRAAGLDGNPTYRIQGSNNPATVGRSSYQMTGISVHSGGSGDKMTTLDPTWSVVLIMKL